MISAQIYRDKLNEKLIENGLPSVSNDWEVSDDHPDIMSIGLYGLCLIIYDNENQSVTYSRCVDGDVTKQCLLLTFVSYVAGALGILVHCGLEHTILNDEITMIEQGVIE